MFIGGELSNLQSLRFGLAQYKSSNDDDDTVDFTANAVDEDAAAAAAAASFVAVARVRRPNLFYNKQHF